MNRAEGMDFVSCVCFIANGLCDELVTRSEESYRLRVSVFDLETSKEAA